MCIWVLCATAAVALIPQTAAAQGFAPPPKTLWAKVGVTTSFANQVFAGLDEVRFNPSLKRGQRTDFYSVSSRRVGGYTDLYHLTGDIVFVPSERFVLAASAPIFQYNHYHNDVTPYTTRAFGPGDPRLSAGYQWTPDSWSRFGSSLFAQVKIPTTQQSAYQSRITRGDGQVDLALRSANTLRLGSSALDLSAAYRHRRPNPHGTEPIELGDEADLFAGFGTSLGAGRWATLGYSYLHAQPWTTRDASGTTFALIQPKAHNLFASVYLELTRDTDRITAFDAWVKAPIAGQDTPVLWSLGVGYSYSTSLNASP